MGSSIQRLGRVGLRTTRPVNTTFNLAKGQMPGVAGDKFAACVRFVSFDTAWAKEDVDAFTPQVLDATAEGGAGG